ncbi:S1C family serine protease [Salinactinospora qingdaonensis]|uniref:PDZ domain-containing protein n=1 Tax=Salinactinospora qingdaonensis TaxID=702744 RepID=A0ABP7FZV6_9ACTN
MSATDPTNGAPEGGANDAERDRTATDTTRPIGHPEAGAPAPSEAAPQQPAPNGPEHSGPVAGSPAGAEPYGPQRSSMPQRPARGSFADGPWEQQHTAHSGDPGTPGQGQPGPFSHTSPSGGYGTPPPHSGQHGAHRGGHATPPPHGSGAPGSGGDYGPPPFVPHGSFSPGPPPPEQGSGKKPWTRGKILAVAGATALVTSLIVGPTAAVVTTYALSEQGGTTSRSLDSQNSGSVSSGDVSTVAQQTLPSVVSIQVGSGGGSGVIISSDGQILTNNHVVSAAGGELTVQFNNGETAQAEVLGADPVSDLAVIKAQGVSGLTPATLGDSSKVEVGADVVAIGSPLGLSGTVTSGVVSAVERPVNTGTVESEEDQQQDLPFDLPDQEGGSGGEVRTSTVINAIQTDAPINPGNSGGPLMNMSGEVIGINTAIASTGGAMRSQSGSIGLGFAIPINQVKPIAEQLIEQGQATYAAMDVTITDNQRGEGAAVVDVSENGAAAKAGLQRGDIITKVEDRTISDADVLIAAIRSHRPDDTVTVTYERDGQTQTTEVTLGADSANSIGG